MISSTENKSEVKFAGNKGAPEMEMEEDDYDEPRLYLYIEKSTRFMYQAQLFDTFVLFRPATPGFESVVKKMSLSQFYDEFYEYQGDPAYVYDFLEGRTAWDEHPLTITYN